MTTLFSTIKSTRPALALLGLGLGLAGCQATIDGPGTPSAGTARFQPATSRSATRSRRATRRRWPLPTTAQNHSYPSPAGQAVCHGRQGPGPSCSRSSPRPRPDGSGLSSCKWLAGFTAPGLAALTPTWASNLAVRAVTPQVLYTKYTDAAPTTWACPASRLLSTFRRSGGRQPLWLGNPFFERLLRPTRKAFQGPTLRA